MSKHQDLIAAVAREIADFQNASHLVDDAVAERLGINRTDQRCLGILWERQAAMGAGQLAGAAELSPGAMTAVLDRLERQGYIRRVRSTTDRRGVTVEITPEVLRLVEEFYGPIYRDGTAELESYSEADLELLRDFLRRGRELQGRHADRIRATTTTHPAL